MARRPTRSGSSTTSTSDAASSPALDDWLEPDAVRRWNRRRNPSSPPPTASPPASSPAALAGGPAYPPNSKLASLSHSPSSSDLSRENNESLSRLLPPLPSPREEKSSASDGWMDAEGTRGGPEEEESDAGDGEEVAGSPLILTDF
uniref:Uncharacterized protein n=1 Tax=Oryza brachyantha TaxID=4533 RepID=J3MHH4_ORYBR